MFIGFDRLSRFGCQEIERESKFNHSPIPMEERKISQTISTKQLWFECRWRTQPIISAQFQSYNALAFSFWINYLSEYAIGTTLILRWPELFLFRAYRWSVIGVMSINHNLWLIRSLHLSNCRCLLSTFQLAGNASHLETGCRRLSGKTSA